MPQFMLVMTGASKSWKAMGPEENQKLMERYHAFVDGMRTGHGFVGGSALNQAGYALRQQAGTVAIDGPFAETKEVLNGYMIFHAPGMDAAVDIAKRCPALTHGEAIQLYELF